MSKTVLASVGGFTPVIDSLVKEIGLVSAAVFGRMWLFCQMEDGVCKASLDTIGKFLDLDRATVLRHAQKLCENGYLKDLTPDLRNRPHVYADTGKAGLKIDIFGVAQNNSSKGTVAQNNSGVAQRNVTVAESHMSKDSNKDSNIKNSASPRANQILEIMLFREVTGKYPSKVNWDDVQKMICDVEKRLGRVPVADDLLPFYKAWCANGWNPNSLNWLSYAARGVLPQTGKVTNAKTIVPTPQYSQGDIELGARLRAQRAHV